MPGKDIAPGGKGYGLAGAIAYRAVSLGLKLSRLPLVGPIIDRVAARKRLKVVTIPVGAALKSNPAVLPFDAAKRLIEASSYIAVTDVCLCREAHDCRRLPDRPRVPVPGQGGANDEPARAGSPHHEGRRAGAPRAGPRSLGLITNLIWSTTELHALGADPASTVELCSCCPCCCLAFKTKGASRAFIDGIAGFGISQVVTPTRTAPAAPTVSTSARSTRSPSTSIAARTSTRAGARAAGDARPICKPGVLKIFPVESAARATPLPGTMYLEEFLEMVK